MSKGSSWQLLDDGDVRRLIDAGGAVAKMEDALREQAAKTLIAPARFGFEASGGSLVFTAGAAEGAERALGFRVYDTFPRGSTNTNQVVVVFDSTDGQLKGVIVGGRIGALRTGGLGGVAIKHLARRNSKVLSIIGAGFQARSQLEAALSIHPFEQILISSRTRVRAEQFRDEIQDQYDQPCELLDTIQDAVVAADVLITTTNSRESILDAAWIQPGTHVNMVGPKLAGASEMPEEIGTRIALLCTDSKVQIEAYKEFFLANGPVLHGLDEIITGNAPSRTNDEEITLYVSVGLAGTEVVLANEVLGRAAK